MGEKNSQPQELSKYFEIINGLENTGASKIPRNISWFEEPLIFESLREADEWIGSEAYNKIGYDYDGYITADPKLAYSLVYQLIRNKKLSEVATIHADEIFINNTNYYYVWFNKNN